MKKVLEKVVVFALTLCMTTGLGLSAMAANNNSSDTGSITVNGLGEGVTVSAYQIIEAEYNGNNGTFSDYAVVDAYAETGLAVASDGEVTYNESILNTIASMVSGTTATYTTTAGSDGTATLTDLPVGSYLIVVTGGEGTTYGIMIGSVSYLADEDGNLIIENGTIAMDDEENVWAKATSPTIEKSVHTDDTQGSGDVYGQGGSADVGDTVNFEVVISNIPHYEGSYPSFYFDDHISEGLTLTDLDNVVVQIMDGNTVVDTLTSGTDYTITAIDDGFEVNFVVDNGYTLNDYADKGYTILVTYEATLNANATLDDVANTNDVALFFTTNSSVKTDDTEEDDEVYIYTFDIDGEGVTKELLRKGDASTADSETKTYVSGAGFTLYTDEACTDAVGSEVFTNENGYMSWTDLSEGTYYLKETTAPNGYSLNTGVYTIVIDATYNADGILSEWTVTVTDSAGTVSNESTFTVTYEDGEESVSGDVTSTFIPNTKLGELPSMGSNGALTVTLIGCGVVLVTAIVVVAIRRRKNASV